MVLDSQKMLEKGIFDKIKEKKPHLVKFKEETDIEKEMRLLKPKLKEDEERNKNFELQLKDISNSGLSSTKKNFIYNKWLSNY